MHNTTGEIWDPYRLAIMELKSLFWMQKIHRWGLGPINTYNSGFKVAVLHVKATNEGWDPYRLVILMLKSQIWMHKITDDGWDP